MNPDTCEEEGHRAFCHAYAYGVNVVGDRANGQLYMLDPNNPTDAGNFIKRTRSWPHMMDSGNRVSYPRFVADMQAGTAATTSSVAGIPSGIASTLTFPTVVTVIDTTFTAPDGVLLQNYYIPYGLLEPGSQYTQIDTTIDGEIASNTLTGSGAGTTSYRASGVPTSPDYIAQFQAIPDEYGAVPAAGADVFLIGRANASNNGYRAKVTTDGATYQLQLTVMGGATTTVEMGTIPSGYYQVFLSMQGTAIDVAVQRSFNDQWLTSGAIWQYAFAKAISITDGTYTAAGNVLIGGEW
jgi:hypothetical protein